MTLHTHKKRLRVLMALLLICTLLFAQSVAFAAESGRVVRVGWVLRPGISNENGGVYSGYNYDYLTEVAKHTGWTYEFVTVSDEECLPMLLRGEIDVMCNVLRAGERAQSVDLTASSYGNKYTLLFTTQDSSITAYDFDSFDGMTVGAADGDAGITILEGYAKNTGFDYEMTTYGSIEALTEAVKNGEVDAGVINGLLPNWSFRTLAEFSPEPYCFGTVKGNDEILQGLNRALGVINSERPNFERELYSKYFGIEYDHELTEQELKLVEKSKVAPVTVGIIPSSAPASYFDERTGKNAGIFMELLKLISEKTGLNFEYITLDLTKGSPINQLRQGEADIVAGVLKTQRFMDDDSLILSDVLLEDSLVAVGRVGDDFTKNADEKIIAIPAGFQVANEYAAIQFPKHTLVEYAEIRECLNAVKHGKADAALYMQTSVSYFLQDPHFDTLEAVPAFICDVNTCIAGLSENNALLMSVIDKGLAMITADERNSIMMNATIMNPYRMSISDVLYKYHTPMLIIVVLLAAVMAGLVFMNATKQKNSKKLQAAYEQKKEALVIAEKASAAKGNFMSRMSHEIRTPLNAVIGYNMIARNEMQGAKNAEERIRIDMKVMDCLTKSDIASRHLLTIINDVLDMSAIESGRINVAHERFDFRNLISSITTTFYSQAKAKGVMFETGFSTPTEEWYTGDQMRINQVLANLLSNAVKFTPEGGSVKLIISQPEVDKDAAHIRFEVIDNGIGMTSEYLQHIWTPFEQADSSISRRFGGTGLGLSITKNLVELMGGTIDVKSEPDKGSRFTVDMKLARAEQPQGWAAYDFSAINALIVDDDASTCEYIKLLFDRCGARCRTVTSGIDAVEEYSRASTTGDEYTVCLIDWRMPRMNGMETIKSIRQIANKNVPIIVITAYDYTEIADEAAGVGVDMFVSKPLFQSSLFDLLANIVGNRLPREAKKSVEYDFAGARVLLVEDNVMNMEIATRILKTAGLSVEGAWNGREAVDKFESSSVGTNKAILMDVQMPVMDGHQATKAIRASAHTEAASMPIIAMTADAFAENIVQTRASGMNDHISKPIDVTTLLDTLGKYIKH